MNCRLLSRENDLRSAEAKSIEISIYGEQERGGGAMGQVRVVRVDRPGQFHVWP